MKKKVSRGDDHLFNNSIYNRDKSRTLIAVWESAYDVTQQRVNEVTSDRIGKPNSITNNSNTANLGW